MTRLLLQLTLAAFMVMGLVLEAPAQQRRPITGVTQQYQRHAPEPEEEAASNNQFQPYSRTCQIFQYGFHESDREIQIYIACRDTDLSGNQFFMKSYREDDPWDIALMQSTFDLVDQAIENNAILNISVAPDPGSGSNPTFTGITLELPR